MMGNLKIALCLLAGVGIVIIAVKLLKKCRLHEQKKQPLETGGTSSFGISNDSASVGENKTEDFDEMCGFTTLPGFMIHKLGSSVGALYHISEYGDTAQTAKHIFDNLELIFNYSDREDLKSQWAIFAAGREDWLEHVYKSKSACLLSLIKKSGVEIPEQDIFEWDDASSCKYRKFGNIENGDKCTVISPYVMYNGLILCDGMAKKI